MLLQKTSNNIFHICAKCNKILPLIFYYEKLYNLFPSSNLLNFPNKHGLTPLHYACYYNYKRFAEICIELNCNINKPDINGDTPLHYAVISRNYLLVKKLLINGADRYILNKKGETPYDVSIKYNSNSIKSILHEKKCEFLNCSRIEGLRHREKDNTLLYMYFTYLCMKYLWMHIFYNYTYSYQMINILFIINIISLCIDICVIGLIFHFKVNKDLYLKLKRVTYTNLISLIKEYINDNNIDDVLNNVCIVCKTVKNKQMQHCIACNKCIKNWDHHCFWLNICINKKNEIYFTFFIICVLLSICFLFIISCINIYIVNSPRFRNLVYHTILCIESENVLTIVNVALTFIIVFEVVIVLIMGVVIGVQLWKVVKCGTNQKEKKNGLIGV